MNDIIKALILNSGISFKSALSLFDVIDKADYNDSFSKHMSDTPTLDGRLDENSARAIVHFAKKNLR